MDKEKIVSLIKILESNIKILGTYKKILSKIDNLEEIITRKFKDREEENLFLQEIIESSNDNYYKISKNCLAN